MICTKCKRNVEHTTQMGTFNSRGATLSENRLCSDCSIEFIRSGDIESKFNRYQQNHKTKRMSTDDLMDFIGID